jgi:membrane protease YdiL (CAAX protease family)
VGGADARDRGVGVVTSVSGTTDSILAVALGTVAVIASVAVALVTARRIGRGEPAVVWRPHPQAIWGGGDVAAIAAMYLLVAVVAAALVPQGATLRDLLAIDVVSKLAVVALGIMHLASRGADLRMLGFPPPRTDDIGLACGGLALVVAPLLALAGLLDRMVPYEHPVVEFLQRNRDPLAIGLVLLSAVVVAPLVEEWFFRRVLQGWLERRLAGRVGSAVVVSALAFALAHTGHGLAPLPLFLFGLVLGTIARQTGSLVPCILLHGLFNAVSIALVLGGGLPAPLPEAPLPEG